MESKPSPSVVSDPESSVSQRVQAVISSPVPPVCWSTAAVDVDEDWPTEWCYDWESDWMWSDVEHLGTHEHGECGDPLSEL